MKQLTEEAVKNAAEQLMFTNSNTTTLEVKNALRLQGYEAYQQQVSDYMNRLAAKHRWVNRHNSRHRIYYFRGDTNVVFHKYVEKDSGYKEFYVKGKKLTIASGIINKKDDWETQNYNTNRQACNEALKLYQESLNKGYTDTQNQNLDIFLRQEYSSYFKLKPTFCRIGYYSTQKVLEQPSLINSEGKELAANIVTTKSAGYDFEWKLTDSTAKEKLKKILNNDSWDVLKNSQTNAVLLAEKTQKIQAITSAGETIDEYKMVMSKGDTELIKWEADNEKLYQADIHFDNNQKLQISKFQLDLVTELMPLLKRILNT